MPPPSPSAVRPTRSSSWPTAPAPSSTTRHRATTPTTAASTGSTGPQLNAYAWIASRLDFPPVSRLALAYMEPGTDDEAGQDPNAIDADGFSLGFRPSWSKSTSTRNACCRPYSGRPPGSTP